MPRFHAEVPFIVTEIPDLVTLAFRGSSLRNIASRAIAAMIALAQTFPDAVLFSARLEGAGGSNTWLLVLGIDTAGNATDSIPCIQARIALREVNDAEANIQAQELECAQELFALVVSPGGDLDIFEHLSAGAGDGQLWGVGYVGNVIPPVG